MGLRNCWVSLRLDHSCCTRSRPVLEFFCSQVYGRPSQEHSWRSSRFGAPSRILEILGLVSCWEPSVLPWHCSDLALGQWTPTCLGGSAFAFQTGSVSSPSYLSRRIFPNQKGVPMRQRGVPMRPDLGGTNRPNMMHTNHSIEGCGQSALVSDCL